MFINNKNLLQIKKWLKDYTGFLIYSGLLIAAISYSISSLKYDWQWSGVPDYIVSFKGAFHFSYSEIDGQDFLLLRVPEEVDLPVSQIINNYYIFALLDLQFLY